MYLLQAAEGGGSQMLIMMALIFGVMYFFMIRPQRKKEKALQEKRNQVKKGDEITTSGGIYGVVYEVTDETVIISIESAAKLKIAKSAIFTVNGEGGTAVAPKK